MAIFCPASCLYVFNYYKLAPIFYMASCAIDNTYPWSWDSKHTQIIPIHQARTSKLNTCLFHDSRYDCMCDFYLPIIMLSWDQLFACLKSTGSHPCPHLEGRREEVSLGMNIEKCMRNCTAGLPPILSKTLVLTASHSLGDTMLLTTFFIVFTCSMEHKHYYSLVTNVCSITLSTLHTDS